MTCISFIETHGRLLKLFKINNEKSFKFLETFGNIILMELISFHFLKHLL